MLKRFYPRAGRVSLFLTLLLAGARLGAAEIKNVPTTPEVGSQDPASAAPLVTRPATKPCIVSLLDKQAFENFTPATLTYTPPKVCPGPWAKVVLTADFKVSKGQQYDRTAYFYLGGANIFYGTTAEPRTHLAPKWHIERDVTDLSALFETAQTGAAFAGNVVNSTYTGIIYADAALEFYPASLSTPAPRVADVVVPVSNNNSPYTLNTSTDQSTATLNLPRNTEKVYLDVISQSQIGDEFWYLCVPNNVASELESCGNTSFRETEISIDGKPAGVAPVYPWIFTGGIDPFLWQPIVGIQTLDFKPYRVDLTPFAGVLGDGNAHTLAISVFNANSYFLNTANLLVFTDHGRKEVKGDLLEDTLSAEPMPYMDENLRTGSKGKITGTVEVGSRRSFTISGYVETSHGRVETTVNQVVRFDSTQTFDLSPTTEIQKAVQTSTVDDTTTTQSGVQLTTAVKHTSFPLTVDYSYIVSGDQTSKQKTTVEQGYAVQHVRVPGSGTLHDEDVTETVNTTDTLNFDASGNFTGNHGKASATFTRSGTQAPCYSRTLQAEDQKLTSVQDGAACKAQ